MERTAHATRCSGDRWRQRCPSAALMAREAGASVLLLESAPRLARRQLGPRATCAACTMHRKTCWWMPTPEEEFWQDLLKVTGGLTNEHLARPVIPRVQHLPRLDAQPRRALPAAAVGRAACGAHQRSSWAGQGAGQCLLPQRRKAGRADSLRIAGWTPHRGRRRLALWWRALQGRAHHRQKLRAGCGRL